jgi:predicted site-specific integrase-resolvase
MIEKYEAHPETTFAYEKPLAYRVNSFCRAIGISRTSFYELVKQGKINTVVIAGRRLVPASEADRLLSEATE